MLRLHLDVRFSEGIWRIEYEASLLIAHSPARRCYTACNLVVPDWFTECCGFIFLGLAKALQDEAPAADASKSPTLTDQMTRAGVILGTAAYMSPEQARGGAVDKRADIWAFGVILFEVLTGRPCFAGDTVTDILAAVVRSDPDWDALPVQTPANVRYVIRRCLQKDIRSRLRDVGDARIDLLEMAGQASGAQPTVSQPQHTSLRTWIFAGSFFLLVVSATILAIWRGLDWFHPKASGSVVRFAFNIPTGQQLYSSGFGSPFDVSPDGTSIVYSAFAGGRSLLYHRPLDQYEAKSLPGTEGAAAPFFSPDGQSIGFFANGKLRRIAADGGPAQDICAAVGYPSGGSWGEDDRIVFASDISGLWSVPAGGGMPRSLTRPDIGKGEIGHLWPHMLPRNRGALFSILTEETRQIAVLSMDTGQWQTILKAGGEAWYLPTGHLLYQDSTSLLRVPFDLANLKPIGKETPVLQGLHTGQAAGEDHANFAVSATGTLVHQSGNPGSDKATLVWVSRSGQEISLPMPPAVYWYPRISPDGARFAIDGDNAQIWICDVGTPRKKRLTQGGVNYTPVWSIDGKRIAYTAYRQGYANIFWKPIDSDDVSQALVVSREERKYPASWSLDGRILIYNTLNAASGGDIWAKPIEANPYPLLNSRFQEITARLSPDGRWLAYVSDESGRNEVYVRPSPARGTGHRAGESCRCHKGRSGTSCHPGCRASEPARAPGADCGGGRSWTC